MNPHPVKDTPLKRARMPVPPPQLCVYLPGLLTGAAATGTLPITDLVLLVESFVIVIEVITNIHAKTTVTFFIKAIPEGALKN